MKPVYMFNAALLCEKCGTTARQEIDDQGGCPVDVENEYTYDSDEYPKGPYPNGGGEADYAHHCDHCDIALNNPVIEETQ